MPKEFAFDAGVSSAGPNPRATGEIDQTIARHIRRARESAGKTLEWTASQIGISKSQLGKYELAENRIPLARLKAIGELFGFEVDQAFDPAGEAATKPASAEIGFREVMELLTAFGSISDERLRQKAIAIVQTLAADGSSRSEGAGETSS